MFAGGLMGLVGDVLTSASIAGFPSIDTIPLVFRNGKEYSYLDCWVLGGPWKSGPKLSLDLRRKQV